MYTVDTGGKIDSKSGMKYGSQNSSPIREFADRSNNGSKLDHKHEQGMAMKNWNHYNSNMNNNLVEQRKILYSKNYELDSRAWGLKDYGVQPLISHKLNQSRMVNDIMENTKGKSPEDRCPTFKKNYTPISSFFKSLTDARVTHTGGSKITTLRPNLNYS